MKRIRNTLKAGTLLRVLVVCFVIAGAISAAAWASSSGQKKAQPANDPGSHEIIFVVMTLNGTELGGFFSLPKIESGVDASNLVLVAGKPLKLPKDVPPPSITLSRGFDHDLTLSHWSEAAFREIQAPRPTWSTGLNYLGEPVAVWRLTRAWPSKYKVDTSSTQDIETVTLVGEKLERVS